MKEETYVIMGAEDYSNRLNKALSALEGKVDDIEKEENKVKEERNQELSEVYRLVNEDTLYQTVSLTVREWKPERKVFFGLITLSEVTPVVVKRLVLNLPEGKRLVLIPKEDYISELYTHRNYTVITGVPKNTYVKYPSPYGVSVWAFQSNGIDYGHLDKDCVLVWEDLYKYGFIGYTENISMYRNYLSLLRGELDNLNGCNVEEVSVPFSTMSIVKQWEVQ